MAPCRRFSRIQLGLVLATAVALTTALPQALGQSNYPNRVIRIIVPTSPGGA